MRHASAAELLVAALLVVYAPDAGPAGAVTLRLEGWRLVPVGAQAPSTGGAASVVR